MCAHLFVAFLGHSMEVCWTQGFSHSALLKHLDGHCGLTVLIERNVNMDGVLFEPIDGFCGTLDWQWHKISNFLRSIRSSRNHVGLFGAVCGRGATVRNIAFDSSCLVERNNNNNSKKRRNSRRRHKSREPRHSPHRECVWCLPVERGQQQSLCCRGRCFQCQCLLAQ